MKIISSFCLLLLAAGFLSGCGDSSSSGSGASAVELLFPLKYGDYWSYNFVVYDTNGTKLRENTQVLEVRGSRDSAGHTFYAVSSDGSLTELFYQGDKVYSMQDKPELFIQYPMYIGKSVTLQDTMYAYPFDTSIYKRYLIFESDNDPVDLGFEKFYCARYRNVEIRGSRSHPDTTGYSLNWFALNKGLIKEEVYEFTDNKKYLFIKGELTGYHVN